MGVRESRAYGKGSVWLKLPDLLCRRLVIGTEVSEIEVSGIRIDYVVIAPMGSHRHGPVIGPEVQGLIVREILGVGRSVICPDEV